MTHWLTHSLTDWQRHLLSCPGQLKTFLCGDENAQFFASSGILQSSNSKKETLNSVLNLLLHYYRHNLGEVIISITNMHLRKSNNSSKTLSLFLQDCASGELPVPVIPADCEELSSEMVARFVVNLNGTIPLQISKISALRWWLRFFILFNEDWMVLLTNSYWFLQQDQENHFDDVIRGRFRPVLPCVI